MRKRKPGLDYALMQAVLEELEAAYLGEPLQDPSCLRCASNTTEDVLMIALYYLMHWGKITMNISSAVDWKKITQKTSDARKDSITVTNITITQSGIELLQQGGGAYALETAVRARNIG